VPSPFGAIKVISKSSEKSFQRLTNIEVKVGLTEKLIFKVSPSAIFPLK
jgi:hypothetical protein